MYINNVLQTNTTTTTATITTTTTSLQSVNYRKIIICTLDLMSLHYH